MELDDAENRRHRSPFIGTGVNAEQKASPA
jgi:hypothetical protein